MILLQRYKLSVTLMLLMLATFLSQFFIAHAQSPEMVNMMVEENVMIPTANVEGDHDTVNLLGHDMGPVFAGKMVHAWIALIAGILIVIVASFMRGGQLMWPILLIGIGALTDAALGLIPSPEEHLQIMWIAVLIFNLSVLLAVVWIAKIFGIFQKQQLRPI